MCKTKTMRKYTNKYRVRDKRGNVKSAFKAELLRETKFDIEKNQEMPKFIPILCLVQVLIHYMKAPNREIFIFQFDPIRRYEIWRYLTPCLIHYSGNDADDQIIFEIDFWGHIFYEIWFGWPLEKILKWRATSIVYLFSVLFASLISSALKPCNFIVGSSDAMCGLLTANIAGHILLKSLRKHLRCRSAYMTVCATLFMEVFVFGQPESEIWIEASNANKAAHYGGALGGFVVGVIVFYDMILYSDDFDWKCIFMDICSLIGVGGLFVTVFVNLYFAIYLASIFKWEDMGSLFGRDSIKYEMYFRAACKNSWHGRIQIQF